MLVLAAFLVTFAFIRTSARLIRDPRITWWPGNVETHSGLHIHHLIWGIGLVLSCGFLMFTVDPHGPGRDALAIGFGVGAGLMLDEFALALYLQDVYWAREGRASLDAVIVATTLALTGALRLARPGSEWARRRYPAGGSKLRRATECDRLWEARRTATLNRIGGAPSA